MDQSVRRRRISFSDDELDLLHEAVDYHYLTCLSGYGVPVEELTETEADTHARMVALNARLQRLVEGRSK